MDSRYNIIITRKQISRSHLVLRAPKYVHRLEPPGTSIRFLRALKAVKKLTYISESKCKETCNWRCICPSDSESYVREVLFKHSKTCRTRYNFRHPRFYMPYNYRDDQKLTRRFYEKQRARDKYSLSVFSRTAKYWKDFLTKCSIRNLHINLSLYNGDHFTLDVSRLVRHLTILKGLEILNIRISSFYDEGQTFKFFKLLNKISPVMCPETKIRLDLSFRRDSDNCDTCFQILGSLPNILQRITHLEISFNSTREGEFESLVNFTGLLSGLRSFDVDARKMDYLSYSSIEQLFNKLTANVNLQKLKVSTMEWDSRTHPAIKTLELSRYKDLLSRLEVCCIHVPRLSFRNFNTNTNLNLSIKANQIRLMGAIADWKGFDCFLKMLKPETTHRSFLSLHIRNHKAKDINRAFEILARKYEFKQVNISIQNWGIFNAKVYGRGLSKMISELTGPRYLYLEVCHPTEQILDIIIEALENSSWTLDMLTFNNFYEFDQEDNGYRRSISYLAEWLYKDELTFCSEEPEDYDNDEEMLQISYIEKRHLTSERKSKRKIFVE